MENIREMIAEKFNMGDCLGFEALKGIATKEDCKLLDKLIDDSWKVCDGVYENDEEVYYNQKRDIFIKYGFKFDGNGELKG